MARGVGRESHGYYGQLRLAHAVSALHASAVVLRLQALDTQAPGLRLKPGWRLVWTPQAVGEGVWAVQPAAPLLLSSWAADAETSESDPSYSPHLCERHADHRMAVSEMPEDSRARTRF